jgi:NADPH-dependent glutamate synthase beta subunit-like oxidoreductase
MTSPLRVAIIGAGPAGIYAGNILNRLMTEAGHDVSIDLIEGLPAPYGLIRYGAAPDHPRIKAIVNALHEMLDSGTIRFIGNVTYGVDLSLEDLQARYHAVIFATGAIRDAPLDLDGIELPGSYGAADFVSWYDGHPDVPRSWPLNATDIAVIGNGNVAGLVSVFGRRADVEGPEGYVFFAADSRHENYHLIKNVVNKQMYVSTFELTDYPVTEQDVLHLSLIHI